jgi:hypothetical protein
MSGRGPKKIGDLLGRVLAQRGCTQLTAQIELEQCWKTAAGQAVAGRTKVGAMRRGTLEILVDNSALLMELEGFHKQELLERMQGLVKHSGIRSLRFRRS